jgi:outer membrane protein assembly factor BamA
MMLRIISGLLLCFGAYASGHQVPLSADSVKRPHNRQHSSDSSVQRVQINRILIIGNRITREHIILRELSVKSGDTVALSLLPALIEKDEKKLFNLHLFHSASIRLLEIQPGVVDLLVEVKERWFTFPVPIFQLSDRNFNEWWENYNHNLNRVNYGLKLYQYNVRGRNETLIFTAQFGYVRRFELMYRIPYIDARQKQGLILETDFIDNKNLPVLTRNHKLDFLEMRTLLRNTRSLAMTYTYRNSFYYQHRIKYGYRYTWIADTVARVNPNYLGENAGLTQRFDFLNYQFVADLRDVVAYPLKGYYLFAQFQQNGLFQNNDISFLNGSLSIAAYADLKKNFYLSNFTHGYWSNERELPYFNFGSMGYNKIFIRGYEVFVIEGPWYFLNKTTLKKRIFSRTWQWNDMPISQFQYLPVSVFLKTYADFGYVRNYPYYNRIDANQMLADSWIYGAGFGIDVVGSYDMVLRFEYSFNALGRSGFFFHIKKEF